MAGKYMHSDVCDDNGVGQFVSRGSVPSWPPQCRDTNVGTCNGISNADGSSTLTRFLGANQYD
eukprot:2206608-Karenia_brevis.AAC.1